MRNQTLVVGGIAAIAVAAIVVACGGGDESVTVSQGTVIQNATIVNTRDGSLSAGSLKRHAALDRPSLQLLRSAADKLGLSARGFDRVRRVARTIADLAAAEQIETQHVAEALQFRMPT